MPIWLHIPLTYVTLFVGFIFVALSVWGLWGGLLNAIPDRLGGMKSLIGFGIAVAVLWLGHIPAWLFLTRVPARCTQQGCKGRAYAAWASPIAYTCSVCGHVRQTPFGIGKR